jgi:hypothetical protein
MITPVADSSVEGLALPPCRMAPLTKLELDDVTRKAVFVARFLFRDDIDQRMAALGQRCR